MACILGKRKSRCRKDDDFLLDPEYTRSSHEPVKRRGKRLFRSIASLFGFGKKKEGIEYQVLVKEELPFQWMEVEPIGIEANEKAVSAAMGVFEQVKKKRPRLEELLGWNVRLVEKEGLETEIRE